eukprot:4990905-Amphidinium_carterae.2
MCSRAARHSKPNRDEWMMREFRVPLIPSPTKCWTYIGKTGKASFPDRIGCTVTVVLPAIGDMLPLTQVIVKGATGRSHPACPLPERFSVTHTGIHWASQNTIMALLGLAQEKIGLTHIVTFISIDVPYFKAELRKTWCDGMAQMVIAGCDHLGNAACCCLQHAFSSKPTSSLEAPQMQWRRDRGKDHGQADDEEQPYEDGGEEEVCEDASAEDGAEEDVLFEVVLRRLWQGLTLASHHSSSNLSVLIFQNWWYGDGNVNLAMLGMLLNMIGDGVGTG